ncbi:MAG: hypothetical protein DI535_25265 [Citrobacter freundii]|nr:MAG: hypothetical protein DI535_25265 [Citrobacter freundii]
MWITKDFRIAFLIMLILPMPVMAQQQQVAGDSLVVSNAYVKVVIGLTNGKVSFRYSSGVQLENTIAYVKDVKGGVFSSSSFSQHSFTADEVNDPLGKGTCISLVHDGAGKQLRLTQFITVYESKPYVLLGAQATSNDKAVAVETRDFSPLTVLPAESGTVSVPGNSSLFTDYPFDNDNWVDVISQRWPYNSRSLSGISYELASSYDAASRNGFVIGSLVHDFWKTGIRYGTGNVSNKIDSLIVYGGAATKDDPSLPDSYGGKDGTHDYVSHGTQKGKDVYSPLIYLSASADFRDDLTSFGEAIKKVSGYLEWKKTAPFYWNSFGVEGVLGYEKVMMPADVARVSDFIQSLPNFNKYTEPVLSIDSHDQGIYTTEVLRSVGRYGKKKGQQMGFYFIPFALWTWKNNINESKLTNTEHPLRDVILQDEKGNYIPYKDGDWGAFPIDPTHPYTKEFIIGQLKKAKAIDAKFIKIDFLSAGALESARRYDPSVRSGIQAYNYGMKMLKHLVDSIMGPEVFITEAISPLFPNQYAHTRFLSTDVYSHLRNDMPGFPHYGSTCGSMISAAHFWWAQGSLWPYTNMDVVVMKNFQKNKDLPERDIRTRILSMITLGSIFGDGTDFRNKEAAARAKIFLDNPAVCEFFSHPKAFTPLRFPVGNKQDQQLSFYLPGETLLISAFNFGGKDIFTESFRRSQVGWEKDQEYLVKDFLTGKETARISAGQEEFSVDVNTDDAVMLKLEPVKK